MSAVPAAGRRQWVTPVERPAYRGAPRARERGRQRRNGIPALDGIRAIAVALVLVGHGGIPGVGGGFIGVDVFFVLSGFLITSLLLEELGRTGRIDLPGFWARRARRLLPALLVVVLLVGLLRDAFPAEAVVGLRDDAVAAFFFVANWAFVAQKANYFTEGAAPSPLQHTWSLGVEEQFYLAWPVLMLGLAVLLAGVAARSGRQLQLQTVRRGVLVLAAVGTIGSAVASMVLASDALFDRVYFGTDTRVQALLLGAAAAALLVRDWPALTMGWSLIRSRWARIAARILPVIGLAGLAAGAHYLTGSPAEFRGGALIAIAVCSVLVIAPVALDQQGAVARALAWRPLVWLGAISYGVYLWHWPIFLAVNGERTGLTGVELFAVRCVITVALAAASWWFIEQPVRRWRPVGVPQLRLAAATVATAAVLTVQVVPIGGPAVPDVSTAALEQSVEAVRPAAVPPRTPDGRTVSVFGDSIAWTLMRYLPPTPGLHFIDRTTIGCGLVRGGPYRYLGKTLNQKPECDAWPSRWPRRIAYDKPDVALLIVGRWETTDRVIDGQWTHIGDPAFDAYVAGELRRAMDVLGSTGARVVITTEPYSRRGERPDGSLHPEDEPKRVDRWNALLRRVVGDRPNVEVLDLNEKLAPWGAYTSRIDGVRVRSDGVHFTPEGVEWLTPWLTDALLDPPCAQTNISARTCE